MLMKISNFAWYALNQRWLSLILVTILLLVASACKGSSGGTARPKLSASPLNEQGVDVASSILMDDILLAASMTGDSVLTQEQALNLAHIDLAVNARTFEADYEANELAGDTKYKGKRFLIFGVIRSIEKDFTGSAFLTLSSDNLLGVRAQLNNRGFQGVASLTKATKVFLVCRSSDRIIGAEVAGDCQRLSQYLDEIKPDLTLSVRDFLEGNRPLPRALGEGLLTMYVAGCSLPPSSPCLTELNKQCEEEVSRLLKDPVQLERIKTQAAKLKVSVKLEG